MHLNWETVTQTCVTSTAFPFTHSPFLLYNGYDPPFFLFFIMPVSTCCMGTPVHIQGVAVKAKMRYLERGCKMV